MINIKTLPKVLLLLAGLVFFSGNTIYLLEADSKTIEPVNNTIQFDFNNVKKGPHLNLKSAILVNYDNGEVLYAKNAENVRAVASLTKLVTAMIVSDHNVPMDSVMEITKQDTHNSSKSRLRRGYKLTVKDLLHAALLCSDNRAARALARATSGSYEAFAKEMNRKMKDLGLKKTHFEEPTGLSSNNVSTAHEIAKLLHSAYEYDLIKNITSKKSYRITIQNKKNKHLDMPNTNLFIYSPYKVLSGKTGYIKAADYCLTTLLRNKKGERLTCVVLGVPGDKLRFREARKLVDWGFKQI